MGNTSVKLFDGAVKALQLSVKETAAVSLRAHQSLLVAATQRFLAFTRLKHIGTHFGELVTKTEIALNVRLFVMCFMFVFGPICTI